jgi:Helix-turn-helix domain
MTQCDMVLNHLKAGKTLTTYQAFRLFLITRLPDRCRDLRAKGVRVKAKPFLLKSGKRIAIYSL